MVYAILPASDNAGIKYDAARDLYEQQGIADAHTLATAAGNAAASVGAALAAGVQPTRLRSLLRPLSAPAVHPAPPPSAPSWTWWARPPPTRSARP